MLKIFVNNCQIYLNPDTKFRYEVKAPFINTGVIPEAVLQWFDVPTVQQNIDIHNYSHFYEINRSTRAYNCRVEFGGITLMTGRYVLKNFNNTRMRACCISNAFQIGWGDTLLPDSVDADIAIGNDTAAVVAHANNCVANTYPTVKWQFPRIYNEKFYGDNKQFNLDYEFINYYNNGFSYNTIHQDPDPDNIHSLLPMPYLVHIMELLFTAAEYDLFGSFLLDTEVKKLIIHNNYPIDDKRKNYFVRTSVSSVQVVINNGYAFFDDTTTPPNEDDDNCFDLALHKYTILDIGYYTIILNANIHNHDLASGADAFFELWDTFGGMVTLASQAFVQDVDGTLQYTFYADASYINSYIKVSWYKNLTTFDIVKCELSVANTSSDNLNKYALNLNLKNHVPNITVSKFLNAVKDAFGISVYIDSDKRQVQMELCRDIIASQEYIDISKYVVDHDIEVQDESGHTYNFDWGNTDALVSGNFKQYANYNYLGEVDYYNDLPIFPGINDVVRVLSCNKIYIYLVDPANNSPAWIEFTDPFYDLVVSDGKASIKPKLSTLFNKDFPVLRKLYEPHIEQVATSAAFETGINDFDFKLLIYHGLNNDGAGDPQPLASHTAYDYQGTQVGDMELRWQGALSLYELFRKPMDSFMDGAEKVTVKLQLSTNAGVSDVKMFYDIVNIFKPQLNSNIRKVMHKSIKHIPESFNFILSVKGIEEAEGILWKEGGKDV